MGTAELICGTNAMYQQHVKRKEKPCDACLEAKRAYQKPLIKEWRKNNPDKIKAYTKKRPALTKEQRRKRRLKYRYDL